MQLTLNQIEAQELATALANYLAELRNERVHTDSRAFRHDLSETIDRLEGIARRLTDTARIHA